MTTAFAAPPQDDAPQNDAPQNDAPQDDAPQDDAPQNDAPQNDAPQNDAPQNDAAAHGVPVAVGEPDRPTISVVAPVYNEEGLLHEFYRRAIAAMEGTGETFELVLVNDGCVDRSPEIMRDLSAADGRVKVINFSRNFGHQPAITAGTDYARGQAVVVIDSDLQDPPEVIPEMIAKWREGYQVVYAVRSEREGETWFKKITASLFYRVITSITSVDIPVDTGDFRLMDRQVVDALKGMREYNRFMRGLSVWVGFKQAGVEYKRAARTQGETKYPLRKMLRFAFDGIASFSYLPLQLATYLGFFIAGVSIVGIIVTIVLRLSGSEAFLGQASTLVSVLFLGGVQLIFLGIIGEYLGRIYDEVKRRPIYIVAETLGWADSAAAVPTAPAMAPPVLRPAPHESAQDNQT